MDERLTDVHERAIRNDERIADVEDYTDDRTQSRKTKRMAQASIVAAIAGGTVGGLATIVAQVFFA